MTLQKMLLAIIAIAIILFIAREIKEVKQLNKNNQKTTIQNRKNYTPPPKYKQTYNRPPENKQTHNTTPEAEKDKYKTKQEETENLDLKNAYQSKWLFTYNEKDAFWKLKGIAEKKGYIVFAKVRLLDILEPRHGNKKYKTFFYKIQAKHVDFVLCDQKLVAKIIIELDDNSHNKQERIERDKFVDTILRNTGYKVIRVKAISDNILDEI